jgi:hypothetical protein
MNKSLKYHIGESDEPFIKLVIGEGAYRYTIYSEEYMNRIRRTCIRTGWHDEELIEITLLEVLTMNELLNEEINFVSSCNTCTYCIACDEARLADRGNNILNKLRAIIRGDELE